MTDYVTMQNRIADEIDDSALTSQIKLAIQSAIRLHERKKFYFNQKQFTFATVASQETYTVSDAADIDSLLEVVASYITSGTTRLPFVNVDYTLLNDASDGLTLSVPSNWAYFARKFFVYPIPDAVYTATISAHYRLTTLSADADTNAWMTDAEDLIRQTAKRILNIDVTGDAAAAVAASTLEANYLEALEDETQRRRGRPLLQIDPALLPNSGPINIRTGV